jgi:hypothetical protein
MYKMGEQGGAVRLTISGWRDLIRWPSIIPQLKRLEELSINLGTSANISGNAVAALAMWPNTLTSLHLSYREAEKIWTLPNKTALDIIDYFPKLEHLHLEGWTGFSAQCARNLPPALKTLWLPVNRALAKQCPNLSECLPEGLLHLALDGENFTDQMCAHLPSGLQTLELFNASHISPAGIRALPQSLTRFRLGWSNTVSDESVQALPRSVKSVFFNHARDLTEKVFEFWPPLLEELEVCGYEQHLSWIAHHVAEFPRSMTFLKLSGQLERLEDKHLAFLPKVLTTLQLDFCPLITDHGFSLLPRGLRSLGIHTSNNVTDEGMRHLPPYLDILRLPKNQVISGKSFVSLPRYLSKLELPAITLVEDQDIIHLPRLLTTLDLASVADLRDGFATSLPRTITALKLSSIKHLTFKCVPYLPPYMRDIDLGQTGVADRYNSERKRIAKCYPK